MKKFVIIILILLLTFFIVLNPFKTDKDINENNDDIVLNQASGETSNEKEEPKKTEGVAIPGWGSMTIPENTKVVKTHFYNPLENKDLYYLTFELRLLNDKNDEYEVLYKSDMLAPGDEVKEIELSRGLEKGEYNAVVHVQPYRMDEQKTPTNNADLKTKLIVK